MKLSISSLIRLAASCALAGAAGSGLAQADRLALSFADLAPGPTPPHAFSSMPVVLDTSAFRAGGAVLLPLDVDEIVRGTVERTRVHSDVSTGWSGTIEGVAGGYFSFVQYKDAAHGLIDAGALGSYELVPSGRFDADGNRVYDMLRLDHSRFPRCAADHVAQPAVNPVNIAGGDDGDDRSAQPGDAEGDGVLRVDDGSVIDIMIVYTAQARSGWGGTNAILALAQNSVDITNDAYTNSDIGPLVLNLVHTEEVSYTESGSASTDLGRLRSQTDGYMDNVHTLRNQHNADLVAMLVNSFNACGIGYLSPFDDEFGFTVTDTGCAVGNKTFPHEIGHNMGCAHDRNNAGGSTYPYAYGWRFFGNSGQQWRTVMSYSPGSRITYFSNPDVFFDGVATGTPNDDNARCHDNTRNSVANFRDSGGCISFTITGHPASRQACLGDDVTLSASISSGDPGGLGYQWRLDGADIPGATAASITITNAQFSDAGVYDLVVTEPCSSQTTDPATLTVDPLAAITDHPDSIAVDEGQDATFTVATTGIDFYQWFGPSGLLFNENGPSLTITNVTPADAGDYYVFVNGTCTDGLNSDTATLTVNSTDCLPDVNGDGNLDSNDFTAWIAAFNSGAPECDQNGDGSCTPADFNAWIANFNAGC